MTSSAECTAQMDAVIDGGVLALKWQAAANCSVLLPTHTSVFIKHTKGTVIFSETKDKKATFKFRVYNF